MGGVLERFWDMLSIISKELRPSPEFVRKIKIHKWKNTKKTLTIVIFDPK